MVKFDELILTMSFREKKLSFMLREVEGIEKNDYFEVILDGGNKMSEKLFTVQQAKEEIKRLERYINLAESYEADTIEKWIIKEYAYTNSLAEIVRRADAKGFTIGGKPMDIKYVRLVLDGNPKDQLHRILRQGYRRKIKPNKKRWD
jgi:capsid portal protein